MISIGRPRDIDYYLNEVYVDDAVAYYGRESMGVVSGELARTHGLAGPIGRETAEFLAGLRWPDTGEQINANRVQRNFFDLTVSPPKSVSILWAAAEGAERTQIESVIAEANADALQMFEQEASKARRGHAGAEVVEGNGMAFMTFIHTTSRAEDTDPQYHMHNLVLNATTGPDGRTTSLDSRHLYRVRYAADSVFQASLRDGLRREFGLMFTDIDKNGAFEIAGIGKELRNEFSSRRVEILADMAERGTTSSRAAQVSTLATRQAKPDHVDEVAVRERWAERFAEIGHQNHQLPTFERPGIYSPTHSDVALAVTEQAATYERRHVIAQAARLAVDGATLDQIVAATNSYLESDEAIELSPGVYTTQEILDLETRAVAIATRGQGIGAPEVEPETLAEVLDQRRELTSEQQGAVEAITTSANRIDLLVGQPGTGKGHVIGVAARVFEDDGFEVVGTSLAARTARQLQSSTGVPSHTTASLLTSLESGRLNLTNKSVLIVDEAGMIGTRQIAQLLDHVEAAEAKLVLVGDPKQLPEIDAGGLFAAMGARIGTVDLSENHRLRNDEELSASRALRDGDAHLALDYMHRAGSLTVSDNRPDLVDALTRDWYESHKAGESALMLGPTWYDVSELNVAARALLREDSVIGDDVLAVGHTGFAVGDQVVGLKNNYQLGILNGSRGTVVGLQENGLRLRLEDGNDVTATGEYLAEGHLSHGYAMTVHKSQGATVDRAFLLGDDSVYQEAGYVGLSRGRQQNAFYTVVSRDELGLQRDDQLSDVRFALGQSRAQRAAIDHNNTPERGL